MTSSLTVLIINADEQRTRALYTAALAPLTNVTVHYINRNGLSARYDENTGLAHEFPTVRKLLESCAPEWQSGTPLFGIGFSAGCWALRAWLRVEECRRDFTAVMFLDGLHAGLDAQKQLVETSLGGVYNYAENCRESGGSKLLIQQNTDIQTELYSPPYASTSMTAKALLDHLGLTPRAAPDDGETAGVIVRSYGGNGPQAHVQALMSAAPELIRRYVVPHFAKLSAGEEPAPSEPIPQAAEPWKDPQLSLGQRCVLLCQHELDAKVQANPTGPNKGPAVAKYFTGAERDGKPLGLTEGNWCMLAQSYVLHQCVLPGEIVPHKWRAGVIEAVNDAKALNLYHPASDVRTGSFRPMPGDLAIWDRSNPGDPNTSWYRHVNRLVWYDDRGSLTTDDDDVFEAIGANEGNRTWISAPRNVRDAKLLGFIEYPRSLASDELPQEGTVGEHEEPLPPPSISVVAMPERGIDVSHHQGTIDFAKVKAQGQSWVICRATYGISPDETFVANWQGARKAGLKVSAYHFLRFRKDQPVDNQVKAFLKTLGSQVDLASVGAPVALDVEWNTKYDDPFEPPKYVQQMKAWLTQVTTATKVPPVIYTSPAFWNALPDVRDICSRHGLWVAHYTANPSPMIPTGWTDYRIWQFSGSGRLPGIATAVDLNQSKIWT